MSRPVRRGTFKLYQGSHIIAFYEKDDDTLFEIFDNARDILKFLQRDITRQNVNLINVELYRALKERNGRTMMLGRTMIVHIIDITND